MAVTLMLSPEKIKSYLSYLEYSAYILELSGTFLVKFTLSLQTDRQTDGWKILNVKQSKTKFSCLKILFIFCKLLVLDDVNYLLTMIFKMYKIHHRGCMVTSSFGHFPDSGPLLLPLGVRVLQNVCIICPFNAT